MSHDVHQVQENTSSRDAQVFYLNNHFLSNTNPIEWKCTYFIACFCYYLIVDLVVIKYRNIS